MRWLPGQEQMWHISVELPLIPRVPIGAVWMRKGLHMPVSSNHATPQTFYSHGLHHQSGRTHTSDACIFVYGTIYKRQTFVDSGHSQHHHNSSLILKGAVELGLGAHGYSAPEGLFSQSIPSL